MWLVSWANDEAVVFVFDCLASLSAARVRPLVDAMGKRVEMVMAGAESVEADRDSSISVVEPFDRPDVESRLDA